MNDDERLEQEEMMKAKKEHQVLVNIEEQYSLWPINKDIPLGWRHVFGPDTKESCLCFVEKVWTDMRPKSLREAHDKNSRS